VGYEALLRAHRVCWCGRSAPVQLSNLRVQIGLQLGTAFTVERVQFVDLLLQSDLLAGDCTHDFGVLAYRISLQ
jgi:hypothetical protein